MVKTNFEATKLGTAKLAWDLYLVRANVRVAKESGAHESVVTAQPYNNPRYYSSPNRCKLAPQRHDRLLGSH